VARGDETCGAHLQGYGSVSEALAVWFDRQLRRAAVSVASNIAEGKGHQSDREFLKFLFHARGSLLEAETQVILARELQYCSEEEASSLMKITAKLGSLLTGLINSLRGTASSASAGD